MKLLFGFFLTLLFFFTSSGQTLLDSLKPQPRQAYVRWYFSAVFTPAPPVEIYIDPAQPVWQAAEEMNASLRKKGKDTLHVRFWSESDTSTAGIFLGTHCSFLNKQLQVFREHRIEVTATYPGPEGYVLDALTTRVSVIGCDIAGLMYGVNTLSQLLYPTQQWWGLNSCRIVDAPEMPKRWVYYSTNMQVGANITKAKTVWSEAARYKMNGVQLNDSKFSRVSALPEFYYDSLIALKRFASEHGLEIIPGVMPIGYSNSLLFYDPNLASGLPVQNQTFVFEADTARLMPSRKVGLPNGSFETYNGNTIPGFRFIDKLGEMGFIDTQIKHSGSASLRFSNISQIDPQNGNARISYWTRVTPFTQYHVGAWVRTENFSAAGNTRISVLTLDGRNLVYSDFRLDLTTGGWRKLDFTFNSLDVDSVGIYWGTWGGKGGSIWWDDLLLEETSFINLIRRDGAPFIINHPILTLTYTEGTDYDTLRDPRMGSIPYNGVYTEFHTPPTLHRKPAGLIKNGDTILVSYYHTIAIYSDQVMVTMSDPKVYQLLERETKFLDSLLQPGTYMMQHDEIRVMNWDYGDQSRGMTPGELLADNVQECTDIIRRINPKADVWVWSDMFDEFHNAVKKNYYLVNGDLTGSADLIPKSLGIMNWNGRDGIVQKSLDFFSQKQFRQMSAPYYDIDENQIRTWKEWTMGTSDFRGMMYTTWANRYDRLEAFGEYAWNHAPYIYHSPPTALHASAIMSFPVEVHGDRFDGGWALDNATLLYRLEPGTSFTPVPFSPIPGQTSTVEVRLPADTKWMQWYITAQDNRGWTTRVPYGDTMYFELGSISTRSDDVPSARNVVLHGVYPKPATATEAVHVEWSAPAGTVVTMTVYNVLGKELQRFEREANTADIQDTPMDARKLISGLYFIRLATANGEHIKSVPMILFK